MNNALKGQKHKNIMPQSLSKIYIHLIFHIKTTSPHMCDEDLERIHAYIGQLINETGCRVIQTGGIKDHVHILFLLSKNESISHVVEEVKQQQMDKNDKYPLYEVRMARWLRSIFGEPIDCG